MTIDEEAIGRFAVEFEPLPAAAFDYPGLPRDLGSREWWDFIGLAVAGVACLWPPEGKAMWSTDYEGLRLDDAPGYFAAFTKELARGGLTFEQVARWSMPDVERLFAGDGVLQLLPERLDRLTSVSRAVLELWDGSFANLVEGAVFEGPTIARLLAETIPGYRDEVESGQGTLRFWKLAHLATVMMSGNGPAFSGLETFPIYPDYMVPRTLRHLGVLRYDDELAATVDSRRLIPAGSDHELAIRWASMRAAELILQELASIGRPTVMPTLDYWLWYSAVLGPEADQMGEHHRTLTMFY